MQGFNMGRYIPPDAAGTTSANRLNNKRAPGTLRADGTQTVRFELPFAVWCHTCQPHSLIGQGVRFNAVKEKVGMYYSTPIWSFRIKHAECGGWLEVRTDPARTAYVVVEGGQARDYGEEKERDCIREGEGGVEFLTEEERERRRVDAFARLEGRVESEKAEKDGGKRIGELYQAGRRDWVDPWRVNKRARDGFRKERKIRQLAEQRDEKLKERFGLEVDLLPEREEDGRRAGLVEFGGIDMSDEHNHHHQQKPFLKDVSQLANGKRKVSPKFTKESGKDALRKQLIGNTRAAMNPFGRHGMDKKKS